MAFALIALSSPISAWWVQNGTTGFTILGVHKEMDKGVLSWEAYFIADNQVILLANLDRPDMQKISADMTSAFNAGKKIYFAHNRFRNSDIQNWYVWSDPSGNSRSVTFNRVHSGDYFLLRIK